MLKSLLNGHWMNLRIERICIDASQNFVSEFLFTVRGSNTATPFENLTPQKELMLQTVFRIRNQIRIFLSLLDPDPLFLLRLRILPKKSKKWRKTLISDVLWLLYDNDVNVPFTRKKHKKFILQNIFFSRLEGQWRKKPEPDPLAKSTYGSEDPDPYQNVGNGSEDPDPYQNVTDPEQDWDQLHSKIV